MFGAELKKASKRVLRHNKTNKAQNTFRNRKVVLRQFLEFCDYYGVDPLNLEETSADDDLVVEDWKNIMLDQDYAPRSVRNKLYALSSIYQRWESRGYVDSNPVEDVDDIDDLERTRLEEHSTKEYLSVDEYEQILDACDILRDRILIQLLWECGLRAQEAIEVTKHDIDRENRSITIENVKDGKYKSKDERTVYYSWSFERLLVRWFDDGERLKYLGTEEDKDKDEKHLLVTKQAPQMAIGRVNEIVNERAEAAGIQETIYTDKSGRERNQIHSHIFRKSYGVHRTKKGMPIAYLTELLGHSDIETTKEHYLKFRDDDIEEAEREYSSMI
ncbi:integrase/recombinase XerD [Natronobacterium gregoryi]|nr:site-specific recombinase XerD [Natronobacterium gregoryi SP2]SFJ30600.1 integrase/recombinase XerD [Natronobacterium gregoryi]